MALALKASKGIFVEIIFAKKKNTFILDYSNKGWLPEVIGLFIHVTEFGDSIKSLSTF